MKLLDFLSFDCIIADLKSTTKTGVFTELAKLISANNPNLDKSKIVTILNDREKIGSTGIGNGVAIPHGKYVGLTSLIAAFGRSEKGIDFDAIDGKKVHLFCLLLAPEKSVGDHLKALARISRILKKEELREELMKIHNKNEICSLLSEADQTL